MNLHYDRASGHLQPMPIENVDINNVIRNLREEHVKFMEIGLPTYDVSKSDVYETLAFVKTLKQEKESIPSQLQLVVLGTNLLWKANSRTGALEPPPKTNASIFQWKIHGVGESFKLTQWLHGSNEVVRASLYRFPSDTLHSNIKWKDLVPRLIEAMRQRRSTSHQGLNKELTEYSNELRNRKEIIQKADSDSKVLSSYLIELHELQRKIESLHKDILNGDKEGREVNERLRKIREKVQRMVEKKKYNEG